MSHQSERQQRQESTFVAFEILFFVLVSSTLLFKLRYLLVSGIYTLSHDNLHWGLSIFIYAAQSFLRGEIPLWNPYSEAGTPFFPVLIQMRLLEPISLLTIFIGQFFTDDLVLLFHWDRFLKIIFMLAGSYLVIRKFSSLIMVRLCSILILHYSSFVLVSLRMDGAINQFMWAPYVLLFLIRAFFEKKEELSNWIFLGLSIGINFQSYFFTGVWILLFFLLLSAFICERKRIKELLGTRGNLAKLAVTATICLLMTAPNIALLRENNKYDYPLRIMSPENVVRLNKGKISGASSEDKLKLDYVLIQNTGTFFNSWDIVNSMNPFGRRFIKPDKSIIGFPSEALFYLGLLTMFFSLIGILFGQHPQKKFWFFALVFLTLFCMGPDLILHRMIYAIYPPAQFLRHTHALTLYLQLFTLVFFMMGLTSFLNRFVQKNDN